MTISYTAEVATCKGFGCFLKLLFRWKGSIYKLVWPDLFLFLGTYFSLSVLYRFFLNLEQQKTFAALAVYCEKYGTLIPVSFVLGFYVTIVVGRWWDQYRTIPFADSIAVFVSASVHGQDEKGRLMRRTIMRYCVLSLTMCFTLISPRVKKRFPTLDHLIEAGLLLENEKKIIEDLNRNVPGYSKSWLPIVWASSIVTRARKEGKIRDDFALKTILDELNTFRAKCGLLISYDWISVPLVYTQVVTLAVYSYFLSCVMGRQWLDAKHLGPNAQSKAEEIDLIFPVFTTLQFFFYMGWLKVAESLLNPFGDDDDDFELNWLVDRNLQVAYLIVDEMHHDHPELIKDQYWDDVFPPELPYTVASEHYRDDPPGHSTDKIHVSKQNGEIVSPASFVKLDEMCGSGDLGLGRRVSVTPSFKKFGGSFSRRERTASVRSNASQSTLGESINDKMSRTGSITSVFKRMFSREREPAAGLDVGRSMEGGFGGSTANIQQRCVFEDVIPELDENMTTIVSMRGDARKPPTVQEIFGNGTSASNGHTFTTTPVIDIPGPSTKSTFTLGGSLIELQKQPPSQRPRQPYDPPASAPPALLQRGPDWSKHVPTSTDPTDRTQRSGSPDSVGGTSVNGGGGENGSLSQDDSTLPIASISPLSASTPDAEGEIQSADLTDALARDSPDESMDDIQLTTRMPSSSATGNFTKKLAKTFGFKEKGLTEEDAKSGERLLKRRIEDESV